MLASSTRLADHPPGLLAKIVSTLDVLSGGRALLGIGAAWYDREHRGLGVLYPPTAQRFEQLEETLQICNEMWSENDGPYQGEHFQLAETVCMPRPLRRPRVLIGGGGERKTLRLVAQYADACNLFDAGAQAVGHKIDVLKAHCESLGRDSAEISKSLVTGVDPLTDPDAFLAGMAEYTRLGVDTVWVNAQSGDPAGWVREVCEQVLPRLRDL